MGNQCATCCKESNGNIDGPGTGQPKKFTVKRYQNQGPSQIQQLEPLRCEKPTVYPTLVDKSKSKWNFDDENFMGINCNESELRGHRLAQFNEQFKEVLQQEFKQDLSDKSKSQKYVVTDKNYIAPHLKVGLGVIRPTVITVGDPFRCEVVVKMCQRFEEVQWNREYRIFNVTYKNQDLTILSHGIGGPGAAICFEELAKLGAKTILRLGTCGGMQEHVNTGDLIVAKAAQREDGYTEWVSPQGFPSVADNHLTLALYNQAKAIDAKVHLGVVLTSGLFYEGSSVPSSLKQNADAGAIAVEMEIASLFLVGSMRGIRCGAIATADGNVFKQGDYDPHGQLVDQSKKTMIKIGLNVAAQAAEEDNPRPGVVPRVFDQKTHKKYMQIYKTQSLYDYVISQKQLTDHQRSLIFDNAQSGAFSNFKFVLDKGTTLSEEQIMTIIILFHKVQNGAEKDFAMKSAEFSQKFSSKKPLA